MKILGIIPARYASTRFPGKPLVDINGKSMIRRVYEQASKASLLDKVIVATDDDRIITELQSFNAPYIRTRTDHQSGTDRCAEVASNFDEYDVIINIQGDEPYINPRQIELLASCFRDNPGVQLATLVKKIGDESELFNHNIPKVVLNANGEALYFSRHPIPFQRAHELSDWAANHQYFKHIGIYGYTSRALAEITRLPPSPLELAESLEQLRWLENGYQIHTRITELETIAIDTPQDLDKIRHFEG